jgi:hypothetical protein
MMAAARVEVTLSISVPAYPDALMVASDCCLTPVAASFAGADLPATPRGEAIPAYPALRCPGVPRAGAGTAKLPLPTPSLQHLWVSELSPLPALPAAPLLMAHLAGVELSVSIAGPGFQHDAADVTPGVPSHTWLTAGRDNTAGLRKALTVRRLESLEPACWSPKPASW